jgi:hypothetical protein
MWFLSKGLSWEIIEESSTRVIFSEANSNIYCDLFDVTLLIKTVQIIVLNMNYMIN